MNLDLVGLRVIITGASRGIGYAIAARFLEGGARVAICARGKEGVERAVSELTKLGDVWGDVCDVAHRANYEAWLEAGVARLGGCDTFVASVDHPAPSTSRSAEHVASWSSSVKDGNMGNVKISFAAASVCGKSPAT
jgi:3-oxoacyl-[acyl-carrier protein] reductase